MKIYRFHFDAQKARDLRLTINDREKFSIEREASGSKDKKEPQKAYNAWHRLCATMTRLEDTLGYINKMELGKLDNGQAAFDFYEFINCAYVVIECVKVVVRVFDLDIEIVKTIENSTEAFGSRGKEGENDSKFFGYIRSLCGVHPLCTNFQKEYLGQSDFHCCSFVVWTDRGYVSSKSHDGADLIAHVYGTNDIHPFYINLYIEQFEKYLNKWIDCIPSVIEAKNKYVDDKYELLRKEAVKALADFGGDYIKYIEHLRDVYARRVDNGLEYILEEYAWIFNVRLSNEENQRKLEKYKSAILYSLGFLQNGLQTMSFEGYENTGIKYPERNVETDLYLELESPDIFGGVFGQYSYEIQKVYYLAPSSGSNAYDKHFARKLLEKLKEVISQYVTFTNQEPDEEVYVLVRLALYFEALARKSLLNKNIPNEIQYRETLLTDTELEELIKEEPVTDKTEFDSTKLKEFLEKYGY